VGNAAFSHIELPVGAEYPSFSHIPILTSRQECAAAETLKEMPTCEKSD